jgi:hypothetical protein
MKKLEVGNIVNAVFLGVTHRCEVVEVTEKHKYKLRMKSGTLLPSVPWKKHMHKDSPWHILSLIDDTPAP